MPTTPPDALAPPDGSALQGWGRLAFDATLGLTGVVEAMHRGVTRLPGTGPGPDPGRTRGLTGLVYGTIRGVTRLAGLGVDLALARLGEPATGRAAAPGRPLDLRAEAVRAALNGVLGDHLVNTGNPLAIPMRLRRDGVALDLEPGALAAALPGAGRRPLVLVHGSCLDDLRWRQDGHDHGEALARDLGFTPVYLHYNTGLHVSVNGAGLSALLEALLAAWPGGAERLTLLAHSMGGLVTRSACHQAAAAGLGWPRRLGEAVFLGTPHHGAPLERGGTWVDAALGVSRYSAPLARLGKIRSAGVTDLRHGSLLASDWQGRDRFATEDDLPAPVPLPAGVRCFAVAGNLAPAGAPIPAGDLAGRLVGDGLVPVDSALGAHPDPARDLGLGEDRRFVAHGVGHVALLSRPEVYQRLRAWLAP